MRSFCCGQSLTGKFMSVKDYCTTNRSKLFVNLLRNVRFTGLLPDFRNVALICGIAFTIWYYFYYVKPHLLRRIRIKFYLSSGCCILLPGRRAVLVIDTFDIFENRKYGVQNNG